MVGYTSRVPGTDTLLNALQWDRDVDPLVWQPHPTAFERLARAGVDVAVVNKRDFAASGLTRAAHRGGRYVGADTTAERVGATLEATMAAGGVVPSLTYLYEGDLDKTGHLHGVASSEWLQALAQVDEEAEQLREALPPATRLLVIADHGMVDSTGEGRLDLDEVPEAAALRDGLVLLGGEARFRQLWCRDGALDDVVATWRSVLGERAEVLTREDAAARGWFGEVAPSIGPRMGDVVVACRDDLVLLSSRDFAVETRLVGFHGSLTADEMLVPVLVG
nr:alkaline phosphatase family protein [Nocardioides perillae]